jgi:uncharacterized RDD family membrane protein YckC
MSQTPPPPPPPPGPYGGPPPPPGAAGGTRPGELLDRFLARLIDGLGFAVVFIVLGIVFGAIFYSGFSNSTAEVVLVTFLVQVFSIAAYLAYYAYFESTQGATLGKQALKLRVVGPDGVSHPTVEQSLRRNSFQALGLLSIIPLLGFLGALAQLAAVIFIAVTINNDTANRQGWHDTFAGGTRVLKVG